MQNIAGHGLLEVINICTICLRSISVIYIMTKSQNSRKITWVINIVAIFATRDSTCLQGLLNVFYINMTPFLDEIDLVSSSGSLDDN